MCRVAWDLRRARWLPLRPGCGQRARPWFLFLACAAPFGLRFRGIAASKSWTGRIIYAAKRVEMTLYDSFFHPHHDIEITREREPREYWRKVDPRGRGQCVFVELGARRL
jgi:hypothetical protein